MATFHLAEYCKNEWVLFNLIHGWERLSIHGFVFVNRGEQPGAIVEGAFAGASTKPCGDIFWEIERPFFEVLATDFLILKKFVKLFPDIAATMKRLHAR